MVVRRHLAFVSQYPIDELPQMTLLMRGDECAVQKLRVMTSHVLLKINFLGIFATNFQKMKLMKSKENHSPKKIEVFFV
jgi:hypothetical protein